MPPASYTHALDQYHTIKVIIFILYRASIVKFMFINHKLKNRATLAHNNLISCGASKYTLGDFQQALTVPQAQLERVEII